jgi:hypothetical protein
VHKTSSFVKQSYFVLQSQVCNWIFLFSSGYVR